MILCLFLFFSDFKAFKTSTCSIPWSSIVFVCFSNALPRGEQVNLSCSIILTWSDGSISLPLRNSYLSILLDDNTDFFTAYLLIWYCSFSSLILSLIPVIIFYILSKRFFLKREELCDARLVSVTKNKYGFTSHFL